MESIIKFDQHSVRFAYPLVADLQNDVDVIAVLEVIVKADDVLVLERTMYGDLLADLLFLVGLLQLRFGNHFTGKHLTC